MKILTAQQMKEVDRLTRDEFGIPTLILMENAGLNLYLVLEQYFDDLEDCLIAIVCGKGNNGGDGIVLARQLVQRAVVPDVYLLADVEEVAGDARTNLDAYLKSGQSVTEVTGPEEWEKLSPNFAHYDIIVDALLGTGITKPLEGLYARAVASINSSDAFILSVDIPSGMVSDSLTGGVETVEADVTVTFSAPKIAHILNEDQEATGDLHIVPVGSPRRLLEKPDHYLNLITEDQVVLYMPLRELTNHKGHFGHVAVVSGSRGKSGAAVLAATAALRTGSGLVTLCTPDLIQPLAASGRPELMTEGFPSTNEGTFAAAADELLASLEDKDAAGIGPGLTRHRETVKLVHEVVRASKIPLVLDADALNAFEGKIKKLKNDHQQPLVLTPHPGELSRLIGIPTRDIPARSVELAREFAREKQVWVILKSFRTLIAEPEGQVYVCPLGNPGMATAGMGDVLTGVLTSLLGIYAARGMLRPVEISQALQLGVYLHSLAGDLAAESLGFESLIAGDVTEHLGLAYQELLSELTGGGADQE